MTGDKQCLDCKQFKSQWEFHRNSMTDDGSRNICRRCFVVRMRRHNKSGLRWRDQKLAPMLAKVFEQIDEMKR